jgi:hypothetical protein
VQVADATGRVLDNNFGRLKLPRGPVEPGESVDVSGTIRLPEAPDFVLRLEMVSELVAWFCNAGDSQPALVRSADLG